jgi:hypothetical protein
MDGYLSVKEVALKWDMTVRNVQIMCASGKIKGAIKFCNVWAIPENVIRPLDKRVKTGAYRNWRT